MLKSFLMFRLLNKVPFVLVFEVCGRELVQKSVLRFSRHLKTVSQISLFDSRLNNQVAPTIRGLNSLMAMTVL